MVFKIVKTRLYFINTKSILNGNKVTIKTERSYANQDVFQMLLVAQDCTNVIFAQYFDRSSIHVVLKTIAQ